jgi:hypothetical protein
MRIRASILTFTKITLLAAATGSIVGCGGGGGGKIMADTPALPYQAPDVDEISGTEPAEEPAEEAAGSDAAPSPAAQK